MSKSNIISVEMRSDTTVGIEATIQVFNNLLMLHSSNISAQWPLDSIGPTLTHQGEGIIKLGFHNVRSDGYQSFYFNSEYYDIINNFFKLYRFPMDTAYGHPVDKPLEN